MDKAHSSNDRFSHFWEARLMSKLDAFIANIRSSPKFAAAAASDSQWTDHLEAMERAFAALYRNPEMIDAFDDLQAVIDRRDLSTKQKLIEIGKILTQVRDGGRSVN
jgi:hypothetical protein